MATLIKTDGTIQLVRPANARRSFTLAELQAFVGGPIELVPCIGKPPHRMYVNEEGLLNGLMANRKATALLTEDYKRAGNYVVGDAVVMDKGEG